jgi:hypothetical protein
MEATVERELYREFMVPTPAELETWTTARLLAYKRRYSTFFNSYIGDYWDEDVATFLREYREAFFNILNTREHVNTDGSAARANRAHRRKQKNGRRGRI